MIRLTIPARLECREIAVHAVAAVCRLVRGAAGSPMPPGVNPVLDARIRAAILGDDALDLSHAFDAAVVTSVVEILNNICLHGASDDMDIDIAVEADGGELVVRIVERGDPFDFHGVPDPDLDSLPEAEMGLYICRQLLDSLDYVPGPPNVWTLRKRHAAEQQASTRAAVAGKDQ